MGILDFFKKWIAPKLPVTFKAIEPIAPEVIEPVIPEAIERDRNHLKGKDFEFLIRGDIDIPNEDFDLIMTPNSFKWSKVTKNDWVYYQVDGDEFSYSIEPPGIQMVFNKEISYLKAKKIVDEIVEKIKETGQQPELVIIDLTTVYKF